MISNLKTTDEKGLPVINRISTASEAYQVYNYMLRSHMGSAFVRSMIQGLMDGNKPYSEAERKKMGRGWESNANFGEARAIHDRKLASYWEIMVEVPQICTAHIRDADPFRPGQPQLQTEWAQIVAEELSTMVMSWPDFFYNIQLALSQFIKFGTGPCFWRDKKDWRFKTMLSGNLLVPGFARSSVDQLEFCCMRDSYTPHWLFENVADESAAKRAKQLGWNVEHVRDVLMKVCRMGGTANLDQQQTSNWETFQLKVKFNDLTVTSENDEIRCVNMLVKEVAGNQKISQYIFFEDQQMDQFMYKKDEVFDSFEEQLHVFFFDLGDGYWRSVKGLGHRIFNHVTLSNQWVNEIINAGKLAGSIIIQETGQTQEAFNVKRWGPFTRLPQGCAPVQQSFAPNLGSMGELRTMLMNILNQNTGIYQTKQVQPEGPMRTAREVQIEAMNDSRLEKNEMNLFYIQLDRLWKQMWRRVSAPGYSKRDPGGEYVEQFRNRCLRRGVPKELLKFEKIEIIATRALGLGSPVMRDVITNELVQMSPMFEEEGRRNAIRDRVAALAGYRLADRYAPAVNMDQMPTEERSFAQLENIAMKEGEVPLVAVDQNHVAHLMQHVSMLEVIAQSFQQQPEKVDVEKLAPAAVQDVQHISEHLQYVLRDPTRMRVAQGIMQHLKQLMPIVGQLRKVAEQIAKKKQERQMAEMQQNGGQPLSPEMQLQLKKIQGDLQLKAQAQQVQEQMKWTKLQADLSRKERQMEGMLRIKERAALGSANLLPGIGPYTPSQPAVEQAGTGYNLPPRTTMQ